jgi:hypothetical protein
MPLAGMASGFDGLAGCFVYISKGLSIAAGVLGYSTMHCMMGLNGQVGMPYQLDTKWIW